MAALAAGDTAGVEALGRNCNGGMVIGRLARLLCGQLAAGGADPAEWTARMQALERAALLG